jgi:hypothetical protein
MEITDRVHEHGRACWWDHLQCRWVCAPAPAAAPPAREPAARVEVDTEVDSDAEPVPVGG